MYKRQDEDGEEEKKFTQKDVDETVKKRLAREKRKWQREQQKKSTKKPDGHEESGENSKEEDTEKAEAIRKASKLEAKVACYEAGVSKDSVDDVTALARAYMEADEDLDLEDAIEKVVKKYPQFKKDATDPYEDEDETKGKSWGQRQNGKTPKKMSGVEKKFYELNPDPVSYTHLDVYKRQAKYHLRKYIDSRNDKEPALFISSKSDHKRLAKPGIESAIGRIAERSGLKRRVYPHLFRKTTATNMVKRGCPRELVAFYLGHKNGDARTLNKHYAATTPDQVLGAFRKYGAAA